MRKLLYYGPTVLVQLFVLMMALFSFYIAVCLSDSEMIDLYTRVFGGANLLPCRVISYIMFAFCAILNITVTCSFMPEAPKAERKEPVKTDCTKCKRCKLVREDGEIYCTVYGRMFHKAEHCDKMKARCDDADT
jgi:hypothetical protein